MKRLNLGTAKINNEGESREQPVRVTHEGGERTEPCLYRLKGLAVWVSKLEPETDRPENWGTDESFSITHEQSGLAVALVPTLHDAKLCTQILVGLVDVDWLKDMEAVKRVVATNQTASIVIQCIRRGRFSEVHQMAPKGVRA
jgi:hypothetical protein